jgi:hypothetical protein
MSVVRTGFRAVGSPGCLWSTRTHLGPGGAAKAVEVSLLNKGVLTTMASGGYQDGPAAARSATVRNTPNDVSERTTTVPPVLTGHHACELSALAG